jgi:hypothetical protein
VPDSSPYPKGHSIPRASLTLTIKLEGQPAVHFTYDRSRRFAQSTVTILDQAGHLNAAPLDLEDVVWQAGLFLMNYLTERGQWPAELRAPGAGRTKAGQAS